MAYNIGLLGLGTVGAGTVDILLNPEGRHPLLGDLNLYRVGVRDLNKPRAVKLPDELLTTDLEAIVSDEAVDIVVELIGGLEPARSLILQAIAHGKHVVTANKAVISRYGDEIYDAANAAGVYVMLEAAVGGGIPVINPLKQALGVNRIQSVIGIINGTTNYILSRMQQEGSDFGEVLADSQSLGYAEADPTADVDGWDAADKIAILAALAFSGRVKREEVHCEGIRSISAADISYAEKLGFRIKLLAIARRDPSPDAIDHLQIRVHPTLVPLTHPLASINGVFNAILVEGDPIGPVMFYGQGAGAGPTASAVTSDMINIAAILKTETEPIPHPLLSCTHQHYCTLTPVEELESRFYIRLIAKDRPKVIGHLGMIFGEHGVSLESVVQIGFREDLAEIVIVTHETREGNFREALAEVEDLEEIDTVPSVIRVL
ncbi:MULTISPECIES: homoserine dehydrogenase [unclassified Roseofilum]|uniref:homoserine dehydrogenase n=1 Tax=unclassified Roseofilum TaxID=2620099 RepID=UPI000E82566C|nr:MULTISPECIES: homoserine dehydrogenase [unclassified Roseofilum]MBP0009806.1 homoserine dehydrogenase [Roseofilum sp. Belize Diploria]MBP0035700.1 homoserine dehydrogenase [Roseofilum sp. Belize BBD 4]HBQ99005.1 homoserine dehydrogenase [Cyanobacteria bacterium UBA11691]